MTNYSRVTGKVFGENATTTGDNPGIGQFGSAKAGTKLATGNIATIQALSAWSDGWESAVLGSRNYPTLPEMTGVMKNFSQQICYLLQKGTAEYDANTVYYQNDFCKVGHEYYYSLTNNNTGHNPTTSTSYWQLYSPGLGTYANQDLSNLTSDGEDRLHALKSYADNGELLTDAEGLIDVYNYGHSTFKKSNFTIVGTPTITNDGFVSDFSQSDYLYIPAISQLMTANSWEIISPYFKPMTGYLNNDRAIIRTYSVVNGVENRIYLGVNNAHPKCAVRINGDLHSFEDSSVTFNSSNWYQMKLMYTSTQYKAYWRTKDGEWTALSTAWDNTAKLQNLTNQISICYFDGGGGDYSFRGEIDLKQFAVNINGAPYLSGNVTGIDVIKPDDYTVYGTAPTVSDSGIATFNLANTVLYQDGINIASTDTSTIVLKFRNLQAQGDVDVFSIRPSSMGLSTSNGYYDSIWVANTGGQIFIRAYSGSTMLGSLKVGNIDLATSYYNQNLKLEMTFSGTTLSAKFYRNNTLYTGTAELSSAYTVTDGRVIIGAANWRADRNVEYDLNSIEIYKNGDLVYQPCLRIPYTESADKYGSKIVDVAYRDRVIDAWEQNYTERYYTLDETNGNFTLPMGEIYGMIEHRLSENIPHIVETYINGTSWYRIYSDGWCEQGGYKATTSAAATSYTVDFIKQFKDTNYFFDRSPYWVQDGVVVYSVFDNGYRTKTTSSVSFWMHENTIQNGTDWYACGYIN